MPRETRVGFVGLGMMGAPMVKNLARCPDFRVSAFDADSARLRALTTESDCALRPADSLADLADCDIVITMLPNSRITSLVLAGEGESLRTLLAAGSLVLDMGSSDPLETARLQPLLEIVGIALIDAPVSGSVAKAATGELSILVGGDEALVERARPVLQALGSAIIPTGRTGSAHAMKALNNYVYAAGLLASCEALLAAERMGLDLPVFVDILNASSGRNVATETKLQQFIVSERFSGGFSLPLQAKDLATARRLGEAAGVALPQLELLQAFWAHAVEALPATADNTEIYRYLQSLQPATDR